MISVANVFRFHETCRRGGCRRPRDLVLKSSANTGPSGYARLLKSNGFSISLCGCLLFQLGKKFAELLSGFSERSRFLV